MRVEDGFLLAGRLPHVALSSYLFVQEQLWTVMALGRFVRGQSWVSSNAWEEGKW